MAYEDHVAMIRAVARALGPELTDEVAFVGGCTTALLLTDHYTLTQVRHTNDVDVIVRVVHMTGYYELLERLRARGFEEAMDGDGSICAMELQGMQVDFMPDRAGILGFTNIWYREALDTATQLDVGGDITVRIVRPDFFIATKIEAYLGRGHGDLLSSRDMEDILTLIDGRPSITEDLLQAPANLRRYVAERLAALKSERDFDYAVQAAANGDNDREDAMQQRIDVIISYAKLT
jgi:predicted nucleotidyltransferase